MLAVPGNAAAQTTAGKAQFAAAEAKLAALRKTLKKLKGKHKLRTLVELKADAEGAARALSKIYEVISKAAAPPVDSDAVCRVGVPIGLLADSLYSAIISAQVPDAVMRLGAEAVAIYHGQVREIAQQIIAPLDVEARRSFSECLRTATKGTYRQEVGALMKAQIRRQVSFAAAQAGTPKGANQALQLPANTKSSSSWWYTKCKALEIVVKGYVPAAAACRTLVLAEVARLTRQGGQLAMSRQWEASVKAYSRAIKMLPEYGPARKGRALANAAAGRLGACIKDLRWWRGRYKGSPSEDVLDAETQKIRRSDRRRRAK